MIFWENRGWAEELERSFHSIDWRVSRRHPSVTVFFPSVIFLQHLVEEKKEGQSEKRRGYLCQNMRDRDEMTVRKRDKMVMSVWHQRKGNRKRGVVSSVGLYLFSSSLDLPFLSVCCYCFLTLSVRYCTHFGYLLSLRVSPTPEMIIKGKRDRRTFVFLSLHRLNACMMGKLNYPSPKLFIVSWKTHNCPARLLSRCREDGRWRWGEKFFYDDDDDVVYFEGHFYVDLCVPSHVYDLPFIERKMYCLLWLNGRKEQRDASVVFQVFDIPVWIACHSPRCTKRPFIHCLPFTFLWLLDWHLRLETNKTNVSLSFFHLPIDSSGLDITSIATDWLITEIHPF